MPITRRRFSGLTSPHHQTLAARVGAARGLAMHLVINLQHPWGTTSPVVRRCATLERAIDRMRSDLDNAFCAEGHAPPAPAKISPYYPAHLWVPETIQETITTLFCPPGPRRQRRPPLTPAQGEALLERLAVLKTLLTQAVPVVLHAYGATHTVSRQVVRLWHTGGVFDRLVLAIERVWLVRDRPSWPVDEANAFLRRLDTLPHAVPLPPLWQAWCATLDTEGAC